jgi:hypothetical protein
MVPSLFESPSFRPSSDRSIEFFVWDGIFCLSGAPVGIADRRYWLVVTGAGKAKIEFTASTS